MKIGYPDTMNRKEASPLKARYTTTGKRDDIEEIEFNFSGESKSS
jgi:hypothetical protein